MTQKNRVHSLERNCCQENRGIPQPLCGEDMPRKSLDLKFPDYPAIWERSCCTFPSLLPARTGLGRTQI